MPTKQRYFGADLRIPYVASWSSEDTVEVRGDPLIHADAVFRNGGQGQGTVVLGKMDEARQRECVVNGLCQVCHRRHNAPPIMIADTVKRKVDGFRDEQMLVTEPPVCDGCFGVALAHCPGLKRQIESETIQAAWVTDMELVGQQLDPAHPDFAHLDHTDPFIGYIRYIPKQGRKIPVDRIVAAREMFLAKIRSQKNGVSISGHPAKT